MNKFSLFISDLHLSPERPDIAYVFFNFLKDKAFHAEKLYILGDLFEYWIGDDAIELIGATPVIHAMKQISQITDCYFIAGNRDFLTGEDFEKNTGFSILEDETIIDLYGTPTLLLHGDSMCSDDIAHMKFRQEMVTNTPWKKMFLSLPIEQRVEQAKLAREQSHMHKSQTRDEIMDVTVATVENMFKQKQITQMIHGHTHRQNTHFYDGLLHNNQCVRYVLGDWDASTSILIAKENGDISIENHAI